MFSLVPRIAPRPRRQVLTVENLQTDLDAFRGQRVATAGSCSGMNPSTARDRPDSTARCDRAPTQGIDHGTDAAMAALVDRIGTGVIGP
jgi:hypothetical protein